MGPSIPGSPPMPHANRKKRGSQPQPPQLMHRRTVVGIRSHRAFPAVVEQTVAFLLSLTLCGVLSGTSAPPVA